MKGVLLLILLLFSASDASCSSSTAEDTFAENVKRVFLYGLMPVLVPFDCQTIPDKCENATVTAWNTLGILIRVHIGWTLPWSSLCHFQCCNRLSFNPSLVPGRDNSMCAAATQRYKEAIVSLTWIIPKMVVVLVVASVVTTLVFCSTLIL